ncbi:MAG: LPS export ABC transporter permease LptG [Mizugakiibacter sp.]|uniref:LPS export ABC transporter permease LptG n=1 Tax=Mizugakiibacter sp. TaxID=1972610 RepID=UPI0031C7EA9D|nr:LPS export ABC transporter permease LptG [Xanthomonadaceae bacterium]
MAFALPRLKQADRLVATGVLGALLLTWVLLVGFDSFTQFARQLGSIGKNGYTLAQAIGYIALTVPRRFYEMFGNAALIGGLLGLGGLAASGELTALRAAGMSKLRIAAAGVGTVAVLALAVVALGETVAPAGQQRADAIQLQAKARNLGASTRTGLWARDNGSIVNAKAALAHREHDRVSVELAEVRIYGFDTDGNLTALTTARRAEHADGVWTLYDVRATAFHDGAARSAQAAQRRWDSGLDPRVLALSVAHPEYLPVRDLRRNIRYLESNAQSAGAYANALWGRVLYPLNVLVLVMCALPFAFGTLRSGGLGKRVFIGLLLSVVWFFLQKALVSMGAVYDAPPLLANLAPALVLAVAATLYFRKFG